MYAYVIYFLQRKLLMQLFCSWWMSTYLWCTYEHQPNVLPVLTTNVPICSVYFYVLFFEKVLNKPQNCCKRMWFHYFSSWHHIIFVVCHICDRQSPAVTSIYSHKGHVVWVQSLWKKLRPTLELIWMNVWQQYKVDQCHKHAEKAGSIEWPEPTFLITFVQETTSCLNM